MTIKKYLLSLLFAALSSPIWGQVVTYNPPAAPSPTGLPGTCTDNIHQVGCIAPIVTRASPVPAGYTVVNVTCALTATCGANSLQSALSSLACSQVLELAVTSSDAGGVYVMPVSAGFVANPVSCTLATMPIIETADPTGLPPDGVRVSPANASAMPNIQAQASGANAGLQINSGTNWLMIWGLHFTICTTCSLTSVNTSFISIAGTSPFPQHILMNQVLIEGSDNPVIDSSHGVNVGGGYVALTNSWIWRIHKIGTDTQAFTATANPGPFDVDNNYLSSGGEIVFFGGGGGSPFPDEPSDGQVTRNQLYLPRSYRVQAQGSKIASASGSGTVATYTSTGGGWANSPHAGDIAVIPTGDFSNGFDQPSGCTILGSPNAPTPSTFSCTNSTSGTTTATTGAWWEEDPNFNTLFAATSIAGNNEDVKNLLEFKEAQRFLVEGNSLCCMWPPGQSGRAIAINPTGQVQTNYWVNTQDLDIEYNKLPGWTAGFIEVADGNGVTPITGVHRIKIANNLVYGGNGDAGWYMALLGGIGGTCPLCDTSSNPFSDVWYIHNTIAGLDPNINILASDMTLINGGTSSSASLSITNATWASGVATLSLATADFTGSISGTTLTVSSTTDGTVALNQIVTCTGCTAGTYIKSGSSPNFVVNNSQTIGSGTSFTSYSAHNIQVGQTVTVSGVSVTGYNGTFTVTAQTINTISYSLASNPGGSGTGGSVSVSQVELQNFAVNSNILPYDSTNGLHEGDPCTACSANSWYDNIVYDATSANCTGQSLWPTHSISCPITSQAAAGFTDSTDNNYQLSPTSPGHSAGLDGRDVGADIPGLNARTYGVLTGIWPTQASVSASGSGGSTATATGSWN